MKTRCCLLIVGLVFAGQICFAADTPETGGEVLATVGNYKITRTILDNIINTIPEENRVPFLTPDGRKKILEEVVSFELFAQAARAAGLDKDPAIQTRLKYVQTEYLARELFRRKLQAAAQVTEAELKDYFKQNAAQFKPPEEIKASHILVRTQAEAEKLLEQLKGGTDFRELAAKNSIDPAAEKGGRLLMQNGSEWLPRGTFEASFETELFKVPKGEIGGPIKSQFGWHVLWVEDRRTPPAPPFVQVRGMIRARLQDEKNGKLHKTMTEELKKQIPVVVK